MDWSEHDSNQIKSKWKVMTAVLIVSLDPKIEGKKTEMLVIKKRGERERAREREKMWEESNHDFYHS